MSARPGCIFEIPQLWQSGFSRVHSNCCWKCSFEPEIIKIGQSSHNMYSNNILNFQVSTTVLQRNKDVWQWHSEFSRIYDNFKCLYKNSLETYWRHHVYIYIYIYIYIDIYMKKIKKKHYFLCDFSDYNILLLFVVTQCFGRGILRFSSGVPYLSGYRND